MKKLGMFLCICSVLILSGVRVASADEEGEEREIDLSQVPAAARQAIEKFAAGGEIEEVKMEEEDGQVVYEAEIEKGDRESEIEVTASGQILESAQQVDLEDCPEPVRQTLQAFAAAGEVDEIMREQEGDEITYEAEVEIGDREFEIEVSPDGVVLEVEPEEEKAKACHDIDDGDDEDDDDGEEEDD